MGALSGFNDQQLAISEIGVRSSFYFFLFRSLIFVSLIFYFFLCFVYLASCCVFFNIFINRCTSQTIRSDKAPGLKVILLLRR